MNSNEFLASRASQAAGIDFDPSGYLPSGVHHLSLNELAALATFNESRRKMWLQLTSFLAWPVLSRRFSHAYIGGGYLSSKPLPNDIDIVLETCEPYGAEAFSAVSRFFAIGLDQLELIYGVHLHFWMQNAPSGLTDYRTFFQYEKPREFPNIKNPAHGIVRVDLLSQATLHSLRQHIRGDGQVAIFP